MIPERETTECKYCSCEAYVDREDDTPFVMCGKCGAQYYRLDED